MRWFLHSLCLVFVCLFSFSASALVTDLSDQKIEIRYSFDGADLILFGAVGTTHLSQDLHEVQPFDVVVVVRGPETPAVVRRKDKVGGIWVNNASLRFPAAPGYYAVAATRPLEEIASPTAFEAYGIGFDNLPLVAKSGRGLVTPDPVFRQALFRIKDSEGLYRQEKDSVSLLSEGLFRTDVHLPANVPVGQFLVDTFVFQKGSLKARSRINLTVDKEGFERAAYNFAHGSPFWYGITAVIIALAAGWLAGVAGKKT